MREVLCNYKDNIEIIGASENNLKHIDLTIPKGKLVVLAGVSGSGKSSLAFDTIAVESARQWQTSYPLYLRNKMPHYERPKVDEIRSLTPAIVVDQKAFGVSSRSTVGTAIDKLHGDTGGINVAFKYLVSEFYSRDLSIKYKSAKYVKFRRGEYQSKTCPYGYRKGANGRMEPNEETAPIVQMIFELAKNGYKPNEIVKALFERNIPTPAEYKAAHGYNGHDISRCGGIWSTSAVVHILDDERYTGTYIMGKREVTEVGGHRVRMKDESQWIKIPDHHPAIISRELFNQVQAQRPRFKCPKKNANAYPLRCKVFCGCCRHAMPRTANKNHYFQCRHSKVNEAAPCHGLTITEAELEGMLYEILSKQAQIILNVADLANAGQLDIQLAKQAEYDKQIEGYLDQKRVLYEQLILKQITMEDYKIQKATVDSELDRLREIHSNLKAQTSQMEIDEKSKSARTELAREVVGAGGLTAGLADTLIDRVYIYPNNQVEIVWKMKDFCMAV